VNTYRKILLHWQRDQYRGTFISTVAVRVAVPTLFENAWPVGSTETTEGSLERQVALSRRSDLPLHPRQLRQASISRLE